MKLSLATALVVVAAAFALAATGCTPLPPMTPAEREALGVPPPAPEAADDEDKDDGDEKSAPEPNVDAMVERADAARKVGDLDGADKLAREAIALDATGYPYAYVVLGEIAAARKNPKEALARFEKAAALDPDDGWATQREAETLVQLDRASEARELLRRFAKAHANADAELFDALGNLERDLGDMARAEAAFRAAVERSGGKDADAYYGLALVAKKPDAVAAALRSLLAIDPSRKEDLASDPSLAKARKLPAVRALFARATAPRRKNHR